MLYFANDGELEIAFVTDMGVSVKDGDAIGYFGTGMKFSIATLLRTGHKIKIVTGGETYEFGTVEQERRGQKFQYVTMNGEPLAYTTSLGKEWTLDMAYRELASNTIDEGGTITTSHDEISHCDTIISISGDIERVKHADIFVTGTPIHTSSTVDIHDKPSTKAYYRTVAVLPMESLLTYDVKSSLQLTEDRTLKCRYSWQYAIVQEVSKLKDEELIYRILTAPKTMVESKFYFEAHHIRENDAFMSVIERHADNVDMNKSALVIWKESLPSSARFKRYEPSAFDRKTINGAIAMLENMGITITFPVTYMESLGSGILGMADEAAKEILISKEAVDMGIDELFKTLLEEQFHLQHGVEDYTRHMQDLLFTQIAKLARMI